MAVHIGEMTTEIVARSGETTGAAGPTAASTGPSTDPWVTRDEWRATLQDAHRRSLRLQAVDHDD
jgi:hypothetical protein